MNSSQYIVVGAGLAGASTAWHLARAGHDVTVLERAQPAAHDASSHGSARIFRYAYPDLFYTELVQRAKQGWDDLERLSGSQLLTPTGAVDYGDARHPAALAAVLEQAGIEHELLSPGEARARWPQIAFDTDVLWHPSAGVIDAESAVLAMLALAEASGGRVLTDWPVVGITATTTGYRVRSARGEEFDTENIVITAGGWLPDLLGELPVPATFLARFPALHVRQEQAFHFPYRDGPTGWPTFIHKMQDFQSYGLPGGRDAGFRGQKVAQYNGGRVMPAASQQDGIVDAAGRDRVVAYVEQYLPGLVPEPYAETTCLFTTTPDEDFIFDRIDGITVVSPCSGHGAKFAPLLGEFAAALATGVGSSPDRFRLHPVSA